MKTLQITGQGITQLIEVPKPELSEGEVLLKIGYVGFCGSDLNTFRGANPLAQYPVIPGHEIGATIEAVAADLPPHLRPGMHATVNPYSSCGRCPACLNNRPNACEFNRTLGVQRNGAMAEYITLPWEKVLTDDRLSLRDMALVEPMSVGFHAVNRAEVKDSDSVMVIGCGMIGLGAIICAVNRGARVIAVDLDAEKLSLAAELGAREVIDSSKEDIRARIMEITGQRGVNVVIEAVGRPETYRTAIAAAAFTGRVVYIGYAKEEIAFDTQYFVKKELDIRGSRNALPSDFRAVIAYLREGRCPVEKLISGIFAPEEAQAALEHWASNPGKVFRYLIGFES
ncbi:MAG: zinc-binding alcohol dehydrogenase family protein [Proteiniphilum sp.]|nr:zinc-binding alcohol dehydrogenase family protein [Proteiniphilum sp.]